MWTRLSAAVLLACAFAACAWAAEGPVAPQSADPAAPVALGDPAEIVATVNGKALTRGELAALALALHGRESLEPLIYGEVVRQEAAREGITLTAQEVEDALKQRVPAEINNQLRKAGFKDAQDMLEKTGMTAPEFELLLRAVEDKTRALIGPDLLARKLLRKQVSISDDAVRAEFNLRNGPRVKVAQVVLKTRAEAEEALKKAQGGADFAELAKQLSIDRVSARDGGVLPPMVAGSPIADAAFPLKPGEFAPIVETQDGANTFFHVVKLLEKIPADETASFDKLKDSIREDLAEREMRARSTTWLQELSKKADIKRSY